MRFGLSKTLRIALLAGIIAGLASGTFHFFFTEPVIDEAIAFEQSMAGEDASSEPPVVSRGGQRFGLIAGTTIFGILLAMLFGAIYSRGYQNLPGSSSLLKGIFLGLIVLTVVFLVPFLKYPANPPAVGLTETIEFRQSIFLTFQVISIIGAGLAYVLFKKLPSTSISMRLGLGITAYIIIVGTAFFLMPQNPDPVPIPQSLLTSFVIRSLLGGIILWLVLGASYGFLWGLKLDNKPTNNKV